MNTQTTDKLKFYKSEQGYQIITRWYDNLVEDLSFDFESQYVTTGAFQVSGKPVTDTHDPVNAAVSSPNQQVCVILGRA